MTTKMYFPQETHLTISGVPIIFKAGQQDVPTHLKDHWWLKANKVTEVEEEPAEVEPAPEVKLAEAAPVVQSPPTTRPNQQSRSNGRR